MGTSSVKVPNSRFWDAAAGRRFRGTCGVVCTLAAAAYRAFGRRRLFAELKMDPPAPGTSSIYLMGKMGREKVGKTCILGGEKQYFRWRRNQRGNNGTAREREKSRSLNRSGY